MVTGEETGERDVKEQLEKLAICQKAWALEDSLLQTYRSMFILIEAILFAGAFAEWEILQRGGFSCYFWVAGVVLAVLWMLITYLRSRVAYSWHKELIRQSETISLKSGTSLKSLYEQVDISVPCIRVLVPRRCIWCAMTVVFSFVMPGLVIAMWVLLQA